MDTSFWIQCNPNISVAHTSKKYFGKYLYKIVVFCPAGRLLESKNLIDDELEMRRYRAKNVNYGGWWGHRNKDLDQADPDFLSLLRDIKHEKLPNIKLRVEEPMIQIYGSSEQDLRDLVTQRFVSSFYQRIKSVSGPENQQAEQILNNNGIIRKTYNGYDYKVIIRDGRYQPLTKESVVNYLKNLGDDTVKLPRSCQEILEKTGPFVWNCYFYTNDISVITFLNLIHPGLVLNYHELHVATNK